MDHAQHYRGKNLLYLVLAICAPAAILYLRIVCEFAALRAPWLSKAAVSFLVLFFVAQGIGAWYLRRMLPPPRTQGLKAIQTAGLFVLGLFFSVTGAIMLEAFGYSLWIHLRKS